MFSVFKLYAMVTSKRLVFSLANIQLLIFSLFKLYLLQFKPFATGVVNLYTFNNLLLTQSPLSHNLKLPEFN